MRPREISTAEKYGLDNPSSIKSTLLRRHLATSIQVLNLEENELDQVARFMGHDLHVHRNYYRMSNHVTDCTKIATIFMAAQDGTLKDNSGQTTEKLLANYVPLDNDEDNEDSSDEEENEEENDNSIEENQETSNNKLLRRRLPVAYGKAMFNDATIKAKVEAGTVPKTVDFKTFLKENPLPPGFTCRFLVEKCKTKMRQKKKQEEKAQKEKTPKPKEKVNSKKKDEKRPSKNKKK